jgi:dTDP-3-amino-3,4,6-trideoxy-alpha-D-glucose transaminase
LQLRNYGSSVKYYHDVIGVNSRLDEMQAAFLNHKLARLPEWTEYRKKIAEVYLSELKDIKQIKLPQVAFGRDSHVWHLFVIRVKQRDALMSFLKQKEIGSLIHYPVPPHRAKAYSNDEVAKLNLPIADAVANEILSLPIGPHLTVEQVKYICLSLKEFFSFKEREEFL